MKTFDEIADKLNNFFNNCYLFNNINSSYLYMYNTNKNCFYKAHKSKNSFYIYRLTHISDYSVKVVGKIHFMKDDEYIMINENVRNCLEKIKNKHLIQYKISELEKIFYDNVII